MDVAQGVDHSGAQMELGFRGASLFVLEGDQLIVLLCFYITAPNMSNLTSFCFMCSWTMLVVGLQMIAGLVVLCSYFRCGAENTYQLGT